MKDLHGVICAISISLDQGSPARSIKNDRLVEQLMNRDGIREAYGLHTCNRLEAYVVADQQSAGREALVSTIDTDPTELIRFHEHRNGIRHLMRVAAGLESVVVGEDEILGQVSAAYEEAIAAGGIGPMLEAVVEKAIRLGKRVRSETAINEGSVSTANAAIRRAESVRPLEGSAALVIGAGDMASRVARRLAGRVRTLRIVNRTPERAIEIAADFDSSVTGHGLEDLDELLAETDVLFSATASPDRLLEAGDLTAPRVAVDLARPRDIDPTLAETDRLTLFQLDEIQRSIERERQTRERAADRAESIVQEELDRLLARLKRERADDVISAMYEGAERIKERELETAMERLSDDLDSADRDAIEALTDSLVSKLLAAPTQSLRNAAENDDWETIEAAIRLFEPQQQDHPISQSSGQMDPIPHGRT